MTRPQRNNNPINLEFRNQREATGKDDDGFAIFPNPAAGWRAAFSQIELDQKRLFTIREFIYKFAPSGDNNDAEKYLGFVCMELGIKDNMPLKDLSPYALAGVMAKYEGYFARPMGKYEGSYEI